MPETVMDPWWRGKQNSHNPGPKEAKRIEQAELDRDYPEVDEPALEDEQDRFDRSVYGE